MFGLFGGSTRKKATNAALNALRPIVGTLQSEWGPGIPPGFWDSGYIIGFLHLLIGYYAKIATDGKITGEGLGYVAEEVYTALAHQDGAAILRRATGLINSQDKEFNRGADDATTVFFYSIGRLRDEERNPLVVEAKQAAAALGKLHDRSQITALLMIATFSEEVKRLSTRPS